MRAIKNLTDLQIRQAKQKANQYTKYGEHLFMRSKTQFFGHQICAGLKEISHN